MEDQETTSDWSQLSPEIADVETDNSSPDVETRHGSRRDRRHHIKCMRKRKAIHASLLREMGRPVIVSHPTRVLCLLNAASGGIACVTREELEATLAPFKGFVAVHLTIGKSYSCAVFDSPMAAAQARAQLDEKVAPLLCGGQGKLLLVDFADETIDGIKLLPSEPTTSTLQTDAIPSIPGLTMYLEFITPEEERLLLEQFPLLELGSEEAKQGKWKRVQERLVKHFGYDFDYTSNRVRSTEQPLPELVERILDRLPAGLPRPDQLTISIYPTGAGIPPHVDSHQAFGDTVYVFSLASAVMMEFRPAQGTPDGSTSAKARAKYEIDLPPRSLLILTGDARYLWEHSIRARHTDLLPDGTVRERGPRLSLTLRPANHTGRCNCPWPDVCRLRTRGLPARVEDGV